MFEINPEVVKTYYQLPKWAQDELRTHGGPVWVDTQNPVLGWQWNPQGLLNFKIVNKSDVTDKISSTPTAYLDIISSLFSSDVICFDIQQINDQYKALAFYHDDIYWEVYSDDLLHSCIKLFQVSCEKYMKYEVPSLTEISGIKDVFKDRNDQPSLNFENLDYAEKFLLKKHRFVLEKKSIKSFGLLETYHGKVRLLEDTYNIYTCYGIIKPPQVELATSVSFGSVNILGNSNFFSLSDMGVNSLLLGGFKLEIKEPKQIKWKK